MDGAVAPPRSSCAECLAELTGTPRFCPECGARIATTEVGHGSRRTVTLLFTDVTGSTAMGEQLDPEAYRSVMGRYFDVARSAIEFHGGTVEKFVGDAVLAVFGVPEVREDDALRAVRAAGDLGAAVCTLSEELERTHGVALIIRTGVNTGSVVTGAARAGGSFATGDAVNTAARLEQAAGPGQVLLGQETHALVRDAVEVVEVEPVAAKGKAEPVAAYRLVSVTPEASGRTRHLDAPLVGRDRETRALEDALERTLASGRSHLVTVLGPAGAGKSRLVAEFLDRVGERATVVGGRCVSYGEGITYWPVVQVLREALHLTGAESVEVTQHAITQLLGASPDAAQAVDVLLTLLGKDSETRGRDQTFWAVGRVLETLALREPVVVTVDDLHWAEPTLLELLARVQEETADLPLLLVCQARPELIDAHPEWGRGSLNSQTFGLDPLTNEHVAERLESLLGPGIPEQAVVAVAGWSGGNPFFVEEIATHLVETGLLARSDGVWSLTSELTQTTIPPTVSALLAARMERLPEAERQLLAHTAVIGQEFTTEQARDLSGAGDVAELLAVLARRDLLRRGRGAEHDTWTFRHLLVRDAAYAALPKSVRAERHERFADLLLSSDHTDAGSETLAFAAHHLEQAARYRIELAPHDPATDVLRSRAVGALLTASDAALDREDLSGCSSLLRRALELAPDPGSTRREVLVALEQLSYEVGDYDEVQRVVELYADALDDSATELDHVHLANSRLALRMAISEPVEPEETVRAAEEELRLAREAGDERRTLLALYAIMGARMTQARWQQADEAAQAMALTGRGFAKQLASQVRGALYGFGPHSVRRVVEHLSERPAWQSAAGRARADLIMAAARGALGEPGAAAALEDLRRQFEELHPTGHWNVLVADVYRLVHDLPRMIELLEAANERFREMGDWGHASTYIAWQALGMLELDHPVDEVRPLVEEAAEHTSPYDVISVSSVHAARALICARTGDLSAAEEHAREAVQVVDTSDQVREQADVRRYVSEVARSRGDRTEERRLLTEAQARYRIKEMTIQQAGVNRRLAELDASE